LLVGEHQDLLQGGVTSQLTALQFRKEDLRVIFGFNANLNATHKQRVALTVNNLDGDVGSVFNGRASSQ
jgi:hypothetical protein